MEQEVERPVKGPLTRRRSGAVSTPERVLRSRTEKSDGSPPATAATALREGTPSRAGTPKREGTPKRTLKKSGDNVTETPKRRSVRASSAQPEDSPANQKVLTRRRSSSLQPETPKKEDKTIVTRSKLSTVASEKTVAPVLTRSRRSVAPSISSSSEPSNKVSPEPVKEIKRITRRSASNSPAREIASKAAGVKATRRSSLLKSTDSSPVGSPEPETSSDKTPSLIPRKRHVRNLGLSPVEENKDETTVPDSSNTDVKPDNITDLKTSQDIAIVEPTQSTELQIKVEEVSPVQTPNTSIKSEVLSPNGSTSHDKNESCAESEDSGIKEMEEFNSLEEKVLNKVSNVLTDQVEIGSEVFEDQNNDPNSKLIQITMADRGKTVKGLDKKNLGYKENPSKLKTLDKNTSRLSPVVSLVRLNADNIPTISQLINEAENKKTSRSLDTTEPIGSNLKEKAEASPVTEEDKNNTSELVSREGLPDDKKLSKVTPLIKITSVVQNQKSMNDSITDQLLSEIIDEDSAKVGKSPVNTSETFEGKKIEATKEQGELAELQITPDDVNAQEKSEHIVKTPSETTCNEDLDFTLKIDTETEAEKTNTDDAVKENESKSVQDVLSKLKETENSNNLNIDNMNIPLSKETEPGNKCVEIDLSLTTEATGVKESTPASSKVEMETTDKSGDKIELSVTPLSPTSKSKSEDNTDVSPDLSNPTKGDIVDKSDKCLMESLKGDCSGETDISIQTAEASVQDPLKNSPVDTNYSLLVNVSYDSVVDKEEEPKITDDLEKIDITSGDTVSSESKTTDKEKDVDHPVVGDEEKDENDDAPEHLDASLVSSNDSFTEKKVTRTKEKSPKLRRSHRDSERKENRKRSGDKEEPTTRMKHSAKSDVSADESKVSERKSDKKEVPYYPDCSMISDDSFVNDDSATAASNVASEKMNPPMISSDPIEKSYEVKEIGDAEKLKSGELDSSLVSSDVKESENSFIPTDSLVGEKDEIKLLEKNPILLEESKKSLIPDKSVDQENIERIYENKTLLEDYDNSVSAEVSSKVLKKDKSKHVNVIDPSISMVKMSGTSDEIHVGKECDKKSVEQSISFKSSGVCDKTAINDKSDNKLVDQSITLTESSGVTDETTVENKSVDKPIDQSSSGISDETIVENKSDDKMVDQSITLTESSGISDKTIVENKSDDKPVDQSITLTEISSISNETIVENKSDDKPVDQSITLTNISGISDETIVENKSDDKPVDQSITLAEISGISDETIVEIKSDDKLVDQSITLAEISGISDENRAEIKSDDKPVDQSITLAEISGISDETIVEIKSDDEPNKSDDKLVDQSITLSESSGISDETIAENKSDNKQVNQSITLMESSGISDGTMIENESDKTIIEDKSDEKSVEESIALSVSCDISNENMIENKSDEKPVEKSVTETESSAVSNETTVENKSDEKSVTDIMDCATQAETSDICKETTIDKISENDTVNSSASQAEMSSASDESLIQSKSNNDASTDEQATNQVDTPRVCNENKSEEKSISDNLGIVDVEISGGGNDIDKTKNDAVDPESTFSACDETLVQNTSTNDLDNFTSQADAFSVYNKSRVQENADEKSVIEALESADDLNQSASQFDSSSVCDKSIAPGDSSTDTLEYQTNQADISGTGDEGKSVGDALEHSTIDTLVEDRTDTSGVCEQRPTDKKTSDDNLRDTVFDTKSESTSKVEDKSSDEVGKVISIDDSTNESQEPFIEGAHAVQPSGEEINTTVTLSDTESQEIVFVKSSSESDDSEQMATRGKKEPQKEAENDNNGALEEKNIDESQVEEESSSQSSCSDSEEEGSSSSPLEERTVRASDFIDDEADEGEETESSDDSSIEESKIVHIQQKQSVPKKKRQFIVCDESSETQSTSEDLSPQPKKKSKLSCIGQSKDQNVEVSKKLNIPFASDKKDKKRTLKEDTKSSVQKKSKIRKIAPSPHPEFEVIDANNEKVEMDGDYLKNIEFRVRKCSESYLTHRLSDNLNNSHATGGVFKVVSQTDCSKISGGKIKKKISCNINFKVEKYPAKSSESFADKPYFCGIKFEVSQKRIHQIKSISARMTVLPKNNVSLNSVGKLKKKKDSSITSSRLMENLDNFNGNNNSVETKTKKSKGKFDENLQYENFLHSITLHDSSSEPECSCSKEEVDSDELLNEQLFLQPKIKCLKPCYSATIQNLGTGVNALDLISLFTKLGIQGIEEIDLSICLPRLFCKKLGYGNIRFSNEEAMQQCVDISRKVKLRGEELWMRACYCYRPLNRKASQWLTQSNTQFSEKKLKCMRKQKKTAQT